MSENENSTERNDVIKVAIEIYDAQKRGDPHSFSSLVKVLDGRTSRNVISIATDILSDMGILNYVWVSYPVKHDRCSFTKVFKVSGNGIPLVESWTKTVIAE
jgi:hypothetical protein